MSRLLVSAESAMFDATAPPDSMPRGSATPAVLQVSAWDESGARFDGLEIHRALERRGARSFMAVLSRTVPDKGVFAMPNRTTRRIDAWLTSRFEERRGIQRVFATAGLTLFLRREFWTVDVVHLQIVHGLPGFSLLQIPLMSRLKPIVWTWHDPGSSRATASTRLIVNCGRQDVTGAQTWLSLLRCRAIPQP